MGGGLAVVRRGAMAVAAALLAGVSYGQSVPIILQETGGGLPREGQWRQGFALADLDDDGVVDAVHGPPRGSLHPSPRFFRGDGRGGFREEPIDVPALEYDYGDAGVADLDGDGVSDLVLAMHLRGVVVLWGRGDRRFGGASEGARAELLPFPSRELEVADMEGDGVPDVVVLAEGPLPAVGGKPSTGVRVLRWGPDRRMSARSLTSPHDGRSVAGDVLEVVDLDGDSVAEIAAAPGRRGAPILVWEDAGRDAGQPPVALKPLREGVVVTALGVAESGRGPELIAAVRGPGGKSRIVAPARPPGSRLIVEIDSAVQSIVAADLDGRGFPEIVLLTESGSLVVYRVVDAGGWVPVARVAAGRSGIGCGGTALRAGDLDGDGWPELVASFSAEPGEGCPSGGFLGAWRTTRRSPR